MTDKSAEGNYRWRVKFIAYDDADNLEFEVEAESAWAAFLKAGAKIPGDACHCFLTWDTELLSDLTESQILNNPINMA